MNVPSGADLKRRIAAAAIIAVIALGTISCSRDKAPPASPSPSTATDPPTVAAPPPTTTASAGTPTPDPTVFQNGGIAMIQTAFARLMDQYINPLNSAELLTQAWAGVRQQASAEGLALAPA